MELRDHVQPLFGGVADQPVVEGHRPGRQAVRLQRLVVTGIAREDALLRLEPGHIQRHAHGVEAGGGDLAQLGPVLLRILVAAPHHVGLEEVNAPEADAAAFGREEFSVPDDERVAGSEGRGRCGPSGQNEHDNCDRKQHRPV